MSERKHKRVPGNFIKLDSEELGFVLEPTQVEVGSGYAISISYDENEKPIVDVKSYGEVDIAKVRKEIERVFPNAKIRQLNQTNAITIVKKRKREKAQSKRNKQ
ncbi:MAG: hypothetical protein QMD23_06705 [Candidatus Bathyarchaeia archaeon]|nr:hypothetical protein [Candidatus Bathyarchaeia archaeon]